MDFPYQKTKQAMERALQEKEGSAMAIYVKNERKEEEYTAYLGYHCQENLGVRTKVNSESRFDLASLTKILATFPLLLIAKEEKLLDLSHPVQNYFPEFPHKSIFFRELLEHRSGFPATLPFFLQKKNPNLLKASVLKEIFELSIPLKESHPPLYSDLNFILLGYILEKIYEKSLDVIFQEKIQNPFSLKHTHFIVNEDKAEKEGKDLENKEKKLYVATARCEHRNKVLQGEVDDNNAWAMGGNTGHAGLFSNLEETTLLFQYSIELAKKHNLGFPASTPSPPFTTGFMLYPGITSPLDNSWKGAIGHTGFVGTSAWHHPEKKYTAILLSNARVHPERFSDRRWIRTRLQIHSTLWEELENS